MVVLGVDYRVEGLVAAALDFAGRDQSGVDRVAELGDHDQVINGRRRGVARVVAVHRLKRRLSRRRSKHLPQPLIILRRHGAAWWQDADLVAAADLPTGKLNRLGNVALEVQPKRAAIGECVDLPLQVVGQGGILEPELTERSFSRDTHLVTFPRANVARMRWWV